MYWNLGSAKVREMSKYIAVVVAVMVMIHSPNGFSESSCCGGGRKIVTGFKKSLEVGEKSVFQGEHVIGRKEMEVLGSVRVRYIYFT